MLLIMRMVAIVLVMALPARDAGRGLDYWRHHGVVYAEVQSVSPLGISA